MFRIVIVFLVLAGCGYPEREEVSLKESAFSHALEIDADEDLRPYLFEVLTRCESLPNARRDECYKNVKKLTVIKYVDDMSEVTPNEDAVGLCKKSATNAKIYIKTDVEDKEGLRMRNIMWHEIGHCVLSYDHVEDRPHIMSPSVLSEKYLGENWSDLANHFFTDTNIPNFSLTSESWSDQY